VKPIASEEPRPWKVDEIHVTPSVVDLVYHEENYTDIARDGGIESSRSIARKSISGEDVHFMNAAAADPRLWINELLECIWRRKLLVLSTRPLWQVQVEKNGGSIVNQMEQPDLTCVNPKLQVGSPIEIRGCHGDSSDWVLVDQSSVRQSDLFTSGSLSGDAGPVESNGSSVPVSPNEPEMTSTNSFHWDWQNNTEWKEHLSPPSAHQQAANNIQTAGEL
jgi:hypothetical protein